MDLLTIFFALAMIGLIFSISIYARRKKPNINPGKPKAICGTPFVYSGQLSIRPEILAADAELETQGYAAIKHHDIENAWTLMVCKRNICFSYGGIYNSKDDALKAGLEWKINMENNTSQE
ncbi:hypothetical protein [Stutzerimonas stutzeri]|jgi:hypothetical protein|uniref:hypothetical protein n=1 Tax=Stutzerimonas stutzeri TaxID=316 RepID=UPI000C1E3B10|nr:hypothetical protein [Stutzerimonas stutzeri]QOZ94727.1 hypothetical protein Pstu14405_04885 [Stutzerimonas stutzeri]